MATAKHTPGPWHIEHSESNGDLLLSIDANGTPDKLGRHITLHTFEAPEDFANARLIAAAPELLAALKEVIAIADRKTDEFERARSAIAKATGEA